LISRLVECVTRILKLKTQRYDRYLNVIRLPVTIIQLDFVVLIRLQLFIEFMGKFDVLKFVKKVFDKLKCLDRMSKQLFFVRF